MDLRRWRRGQTGRQAARLPPVRAAPNGQIRPAPSLSRPTTRFANDDLAGALGRHTFGAGLGNAATVATSRRYRPEPAPSPASSVDQSTPTLLGSALPDPAPRRRRRPSNDDKAKWRRSQAGPRDGAARAHRALAPSPTHRRKARPRRHPPASPCSSQRTDEQNKPAPAAAPATTPLRVRPAERRTTSPPPRRVSGHR